MQVASAAVSVWSTGGRLWRKHGLRFRAACMAAQTDTTDARETTAFREAARPLEEGGDQLGAEGRGRLLVEILAKDRRHLERFAVRVAGGSPADGEDVFQQACLQFCRVFPGGSNPLGWLFVVIRNEASEIHRKKRTRQETPIHSNPDRSGHEGPRPEALVECEGALVDELVVRREETRVVRRVMRELKPDERRAMVLLGCGYTYREIQDKMDWTYTKTNRCLAEGRAAAREQLARHVEC